MNWEPIETAPKDGSWLILAGLDMYGANDPGGARWRVARGRWDEKIRGGCWMGTGTHYPPSHWQPYRENEPMPEHP